MKGRGSAAFQIFSQPLRPLSWGSRWQACLCVDRGIEKGRLSGVVIVIEKMPVTPVALVPRSNAADPELCRY